MKKKTLFVGKICVDIIATCNEFPKEDEDRRVSEYYWQRGGNAATSSTVLAMLGARSEYMGTMANDIESNFLRENLRSYSVSVENCKTHTGTKTGVSMVILNKANGSRTILHYPMNMPELTYDDFCKLNLSEYRWIHFEGRPSPEEIRKMIEIIIKFNNEHPERERIKISLELEKKNRLYLDPLISLVDVIFISKDKAQEAGFSNKDDAVKNFIRKCHTGGIVICPWGEQGAVALGTDGVICRSNIFPPDVVVDTLGAGDTFNAATIFALGHGKPLQEAITFGCQVAGAKCGMKGNSGLKDLNILQNFLS